MIPGRLLVHIFTLTVYHIFPPMSNERQDFPENAGFSARYVGSFSLHFFLFRQREKSAKKEKLNKGLGHDPNPFLSS